MTSRYIEAARTLCELYEEAEGKITSLSLTEGDQYTNQDEINSIYFFSRDLEYLEDCVNSLLEKIQ